MNKTFFFRFIALSLVTCHLMLFSCDSRNPNLSKKQLRTLFFADKVLSESKSETEARPIPTMPEGYVPQAGVKYRQERDISVPPVRIDVLKGIDNVRNVTLSQIANDITYINIGKHRLGTNFVQAQLTPHGILVNSLDGVWLYNFDGQFIKEIYKNYLLTDDSADAMIQTSAVAGYITYNKVIGVEQIRYNEKDDRIWLKFRENVFITQLIGYLGYIDMNSQLNQLNVSVDELEQDTVVPLANFEKGDLWYADDFVSHRSFDPFIINNSLITTTFQGDTLCRFTFGFDSITALGMRKSQRYDSGNNYYFRDTHTFRPSNNDTLFRLTAANEVKPVYILDMGTSGKATKQGNISDVNTELMYRISSLHEDEHYFYLKFYTGAVRKQTMWWGLFDKNRREFYTVPVVGEGNIWGWDRGIENDIDGGLPFWPREVGGHGEKYMYIIGKNMKNRLDEEWFSKSKTQPTQRLIQFMQSLEDDDLVIIIAK